MMISECVAKSSHTQLAMHELVGMCDKFGVAMLASNLPSTEKHYFAMLYADFKKKKQFVV